jgi:ferric-dicitrate binding protein FerR (iron transport regulator)
MSTGRSDVEDRLASLFQRLAGSVPVPEAMWTEAHTMPASPALLRRRPALLGLAAVFAAAACLLVAVTL